MTEVVKEAKVVASLEDNKFKIEFDLDFNALAKELAEKADNALTTSIVDAGLSATKNLGFKKEVEFDLVKNS